MRLFNFCSECGVRIYPGHKYLPTFGHRLCQSCAKDLFPTKAPSTLHTLEKRGATPRRPGAPLHGLPATAGAGERGKGGHPSPVE